MFIYALVPQFVTFGALNKIYLKQVTLLLIFGIFLQVTY